MTPFLRAVLAERVKEQIVRVQPFVTMLSNKKTKNNTDLVQ